MPDGSTERLAEVAQRAALDRLDQPSVGVARSALAGESSLRRLCAVTAAEHESSGASLVRAVSVPLRDALMRPAVIFGRITQG
jgi:hypothetical protein